MEYSLPFDDITLYTEVRGLRRAKTPLIEDLLTEFNRHFKNFSEIRNLSSVFYNPIHCDISLAPLPLQLEFSDLQPNLVLKYSDNKGLDF